MKNSQQEADLTGTQSEHASLVERVGSPATDSLSKVDRILSFGYKGKLVYAKIVANNYDVSYFSFLRIKEC